MKTKQEILAGYAAFSKKDQIMIVLGMFSDPRLLQFEENEPVNLGETKSSFSVTPKEIRNYVSENGLQDLPQNVISEKQSSADGQYLIKENNTFVLFDQERGVRFHEKIFQSREEALNAYVEKCIDEYTF